MVHPSSSVLHILKSPLNLKCAQSYKVCYIALSILHTKTKKIIKRVTLSSLRGESQVNVSHLLVELGLVPFYKHGFLKLHLVLSGCRVQDLEAIRFAGCSTKL